MFYCTPEGFYRSTLLDAETWLSHGFGTRFNDSPLGDYTRVKQIHSATVLPATEARRAAREADGLIATQPGEVVGIRTADCVPLLLADRKRRIVAAVHAGWRGTTARISARALELFGAEYGSDPSDVLAVIGPAIGSCCFEVGPEVAEQFDPKHVKDSGRFPTTVDLIAANREQIHLAGVPAKNIDAAGLCTFCDRDSFHSWRRDRESSGRMAAVIAIRPAG
jgi:YfiH family protein